MRRSTLSKHISSSTRVCFGIQHSVNSMREKRRTKNIYFDLRSWKWFSNALLSTAIKYYDRFDRWIVQSNILEETTKLCNIKYYLDGYLREGRERIEAGG